MHPGLMAGGRGALLVLHRLGPLPWVPLTTPSCPLPLEACLGAFEAPRLQFCPNSYPISHLRALPGRQLRTPHLWPWCFEGGPPKVCWEPELPFSTASRPELVLASAWWDGVHLAFRRRPPAGSPSSFLAPRLPETRVCLMGKEPRSLLDPRPPLGLALGTQGAKS